MPWKMFLRTHLGAIAARERLVLSIKSECLS